MCKGNSDCGCGCNNFEGNVDAIEEQGAYVGFDGADEVSLDEDFDNLIMPFSPKWKARRDAVKVLKAEGMSGADARKLVRSNEVQGKPLTDKSSAPKSTGSVSDTSEVKKSPQTPKEQIMSGAKDMIQEEIDKVSGANQAPVEEVQEAGLMSKNAMFIVGGVLVAGIAGFFIWKKFKK